MMNNAIASIIRGASCVMSLLSYAPYIFVALHLFLCAVILPFIDDA